jgi:hypothetical protein
MRSDIVEYFTARRTFPIRRAFILEKVDLRRRNLASPTRILGTEQTVV